MSERNIHFISDIEKETDGFVHIIDDDKELGSALYALLGKLSIPSNTYNSAEKFVNSMPHSEIGCILLDMRMEGMSGLELQAKLNRQNCRLPIIFLTGHGTIRIAVEAVKRGAFEFLEKPFNNERLVQLVKAAINKSEKDFSKRQKLHSLTPREKEVFDLIIAGKTNKVVANKLGISLSTIEFHRANIMKKLNARSLEELIKLII